MNIDIDAQVAEKIFGMKMYRHTDGGREGIEYLSPEAHWCDNGWHHLRDDPAYLKMNPLADQHPELRHACGPKSYSTELRYAFEVVNKILERESFWFDMRIDGSRVKCIFIERRARDNVEYFSVAYGKDVVPMSICQAALNVVDRENTRSESESS